MTAPIVLLTDFGSADWYVAALKGRLLTRAPEATVVDLTHAIPPGDVRRAAFVLGETWRWFPTGSVFLAVVDPGVGSARRPLAAGAAGRFFVGPDNGVLSDPLAESGAEARVLDPARLGIEALSATFHGRDLFAPAAAALAGGAALARLGEPALDPVRLTPERPRREPGRLVAHVVYVDRFGDCITDATEADLAALQSEAAGQPLRVAAGQAIIEGVSRTYADGAPHTAVALIGSTGRLEIAVRDGHAGSRLGIGPGDAVLVEWGKPLA